MGGSVHELGPVPRRGLRWALFIGLTGPLLGLSSAPWGGKGLVVVMNALVFGTFMTSRVEGERFHRRMTVCFVPLRERRWKVGKFVQVETEVEPRAGIWTFALLGGSTWLVWRICDFLFPWAGGEYKLWLRPPRGERVLAWQGNGEDRFRENLERLQSATGLPVGRC